MVWVWAQADETRAKTREINKVVRISFLALAAASAAEVTDLSRLSRGAGRLESADKLAEDGVDASEPLSEGIELALESAAGDAVDAGAGDTDDGAAGELGDVLAAFDTAGGANGVVFLLGDAEVDHADPGSGDQEFRHRLLGEGEEAGKCPAVVGGKVRAEGVSGQSSRPASPTIVEPTRASGPEPASAKSERRRCRKNWERS